MKELGSVATRSLRVVFFETGKRIAHRIEVLIDNKWQPQLVSSEGDDNEPWPPSPALQSLHIERHGADDIAFLVGMAGRSHWSASIRANQTLDQIEFETACRVSVAPDWLGSTYELLHAAHRQSPSQTPLQVAVAQPLILVTEQNEWTLSAPLADSPTPKTVAWRYSLAIAPAGT